MLSDGMRTNGVGRRGLLTGLGVVLVLCAMSGAGHVSADTLYWDGSESGSWNDIDNWDTSGTGGVSPAALPGEIDDVKFHVAGAANLDTVLGESLTVMSVEFLSSATSPVTVSIGSSLALNSIGGTVSVASGSGSHTIATGIQMHSGTHTFMVQDPAATLTMRSLSNSSNHRAPHMVFDGVGSITITEFLKTRAGGTLTKNGTGILTIAGLLNGGGQGGMIVNGGTLLMNGSTVNTFPLTVNDGGTLGGTGTMGGTDTAVTITSGGTLDAGIDGIGTLGTGPLTFEEGATNRVDINGESNDLIEVTGDLTLAGTIVPVLGDEFTTGSYPIMTYTGAFTNNGVVIDEPPQLRAELTTTGGVVRLAILPPLGTVIQVF